LRRKLVVVLVAAAVAAVGCVGPRRVDGPAVPARSTAAAQTAESTEETSTEETPRELEPVEYEEQTWTWDGGPDAVADAPTGWTRIDRGPGWWDLHDPTEQVILRIQVLQGGPPAELAAAELVRLAPAQGFTLVDQKLLSGEAESEDGWLSGWEIQYGYDREGTPRLATLRYLGTLEATFGAVALLTPPELHDTALPVLERVTASIRWVD
jgi:hypothetical protein